MCPEVVRTSVFSLSGGYWKTSSRKEYNMGKGKREEEKRILTVKTKGLSTFFWQKRERNFFHWGDDV